MRKRKKSKLRTELESWAKVIALVLVIRFFVIHPFHIPSGSMEDTLYDGDFLFASKFIYGLKIPWTNHWMCRFRSPKRGDIIIFRYPLGGKDLIKRCIAVEGDVVEIRDKKVYVNGEDLVEPYVKHLDAKSYRAFKYEGDYQRAWEERNFLNVPYVRDNFGPVRVPRNHLFMLGDNRDNSSDSRFWGPVDMGLVKGMAMVIWFSYHPPWYRIFRNPVTNIRWRRIGDLIR